MGWRWTRTTSAARDAAGADDPRRSRLQANLDACGIPRARRRQWPQGDRRTGNGRSCTWRASGFRHHRSRSARSRPDHAGRSDRTAVRERQRVAAARVVVDGRTVVSEGRCTGVDLPAIERNCAESTASMQASSRAFNAPGRRFRRRCRTGSKRNWIAVSHSVFNVRRGRNASNEEALRYFRQFRIAEENSACIEIAGKVSWSATRNGTGRAYAGHGAMRKRDGRVVASADCRDRKRAATSYCARLFADFGATVQKIEPPQGDPLRRTAPLTPKGTAPGLRFSISTNRASRSTLKMPARRRA